MKAPGGVLRRFPDRWPVAHSALLSGAQIAVVSACLWKLLAFAAVSLVFCYAALACWPDLGISTQQLLDWSVYYLQHEKLSPALEAHVRWIFSDERLAVLKAHFDSVRDGYAGAVVSSLLLLAAAGYVGLWLARSYLVEGWKERRANPGPAALAARERLLGEARAALPAGFLETKLAIARDTFVRHRWPGGITTYLANWLLVLLGHGKTEEYRFVLSHEAFHLRCFDPLASRVSKSLRPILMVFGGMTCASTATDWIDDLLGFRTPPPLRAIVFVAIFAWLWQRLRRSDVAFQKHKELLADRFAGRAEPDADLALIYSRARPGITHPTRLERERFLRQESCSTGALMFLSAQEVIAYCVVVISSRIFDDPMGPLPRLLELPSFVLALAGSLFLAFEACLWRLPRSFRRPLATRAGLLLLFCLACSGITRTPWFTFSLVILFVLVLMGLREEPGEEAADRTEDVAGPELAPVMAKEPRLARTWEASGRVLSWAALLVTSFMALDLLLGCVLIGLHSEPLPPAFGMLLPSGWSGWGREATTFLEIGAVIAAACVNLKRPRLPTLAIEWWAYASMTVACGAFLLLLYDGAQARGWLGVVDWLRGIPWSDQAALRRLNLPFGDTSRARIAGVAFVPVAAITSLYVWRVRALLALRLKERQDGDS